MRMDSSGPLRKTTACPSDSTCSRMGEGTMNRPFSSTLQRYSPANINETFSRIERSPGAVADPLFEIRTYESPFLSKLECRNLPLVQVAVERSQGDLEVAAGLLRRHQLALGLFDHQRTAVEKGS